MSSERCVKDLSGPYIREVVGAKGFEPSTSWSRTRDKNHLSRCPGVSYSFSGRSLLDKFGQVFEPYRRSVRSQMCFLALAPHRHSFISTILTALDENSLPPSDRATDAHLSH